MGRLDQGLCNFQEVTFLCCLGLCYRSPSVCAVLLCSWLPWNGPGELGATAGDKADKASSLAKWDGKDLKSTFTTDVC